MLQKLLEPDSRTHWYKCIWELAELSTDKRKKKEPEGFVIYPYYLWQSE